MPSLPDTIAPMLAGTSEPFDSDEHVFEVKWDGMRVVVFVEKDGYRIQNRRLVDVTHQYPELEQLGDLPAGAALDGEIVILEDGRPVFERMQKRWGTQRRHDVARLAAEAPCTFVAFDLLYEAYEDLMRLPLATRRERLEALLAPVHGARVAFSEGIVGPGKAFFEQAFANDLEGVVAKKLESAYRPGRRGTSWLKIKCRKTLHCAVIGFIAEGDDLRSLVVAAPDDDGALRSVGRVGSGLTAALREKLIAALRERVRDEPVVPCAHQATWVEPELLCTVEYAEKTSAGELRAPVFKGLVEA